MRRGVLLMLTAVLLALPAVLAFASGGASDTARPAFTAAACLLLACAALAVPADRFRLGLGGRITLCAFAGLAGWAALSLTWTVDTANGRHAVELVVGYLALTAAAVLLLRGSDTFARRRVRAVDPALLAGIVVVIGYGLAARLLPGALPVEVIARAGGRLTQPLTYWNAEGLLAALGLVLSVRIASDVDRHAALRSAAVGVTPLLAIGIELSYSRAAITAAAAGILLLVIFAESRAASSWIAGTSAISLLGPLLLVPFAAVRADANAPDRDGLIVAFALAVLLVACAAAAFFATRGPLSGGPLPNAIRRAAVAALILLAVTPTVTAAVSRSDRGAATFGASANRLTQAGSNRAEYWTVALRTLGDHPLVGAGTGSFEVTWLRERTIDEKVMNAHSLTLETGAELGLVGLALLLTAIGGAVVAIRRTPSPTTVAGAVAGLVVWLVGSSVDWHWQMPAITGIAMILLAAVLAAEDPQPADGR